jgi:hypothetical protein
MPRRAAPKCRRKGNADHIDETVEVNLGRGDCFGPWDIPTRHEFAREWRRGGDEITRRWIEAFPGSRPMAAYILGEIEPPTFEPEHDEHRPRPLRPIAGLEVEIDDVSFHQGERELRHLVELGIVGNREERLALERLAGPSPTDHLRYRSVYRDIPEPAPPKRIVDEE